MSMNELIIRVDGSGRGQNLLSDLAEGDLLDRLWKVEPEQRAEMLRGDYGIEVSPWVLESLPTRHAAQALKAQIDAFDYGSIVAGPERVHVVFCLLFPFPLPFFELRGGENG